MTKEQKIKNIVSILERDKPLHTEVYTKKIASYIDMRNGGHGGKFRGVGASIRSLHFKDWKDSDFQTLLEYLSEVTVMTQEDRVEFFPHEYRTFFEKIKYFFNSKKDQNGAIDKSRR